METGKAEYARCDCQHCGGSIEIPREYLGSEHECPHCGKTTKLDEKPPAAAPPTLKTKPEYFELPTDFPVKPMRVSRRRPGQGYTVIATIGFLIGLGMILGSFTEVDAKTVFQQIAGRLLGVAGVVVCGLAVLVEMISPVLRYLWEVSMRLESIEERLARISRKP